MKIIDLLNKIASGEKVPDAIKWGCHDFEWFVYEYKAKGELGEPTLLDYLSQCPHMLNDEIIIFYKIEEKKIPEKIIPTSLKSIDNLDEKIEIAHIDTISVIETLNQLIDYLKSKGE
jgi:hypothetical protein